MRDGEERPSVGLDLVATLRSVVALLSGDVDSEARLFHAVTASLQRLGLRGAILLRDDAGSTMTVHAPASHPVVEQVERLTGLRAEGYRFDANDVDVYAEVLAKGEALYLDDTRVVIDQLAPPAARPFLTLLHRLGAGVPGVYAPLRVSGRIVGVLSATGPAVTRADLPAFDAFAAGVSMAMENIRLLRARPRGAADPDVVGRVLTAALRGEALDTTIASALEAITGGTGRVAGAAVALLDPSGRSTRRVLQRGAIEPVAEALRAGCPAWSWNEWHLRHAGTTCGACGKADACPIARVASVPIADRERLYGVLCAAPAGDLTRDELEATLLPIAAAFATVLAKEDAEAARVRADERYLHAQRLQAIGQLAGGIAHDFNNLLTAIQLTVALVKRDSAEKARAELAEIEQACDRGARLTRQLLMFSRRQALAPQPVDPSDLVAQLHKMLGRVLGEDVALRVEPDPRGWLVMADAGALEQVIMNLVVNARDAMPGGGELEIHVEAHPDLAPPRGKTADPSARDWVCIRVRDTGLGMDAATKARIFEPFFTSKGDRGTGLGLSVVHGVVHDAGGWIDVESEPGRGTTFCVWLPRTAAAPRSATIPAGGPAPTPLGARVLVVEDEVGLGNGLARLLAGEGYTPLLVRTAEDAREHAHRELRAIDALVCDVILPDGSGVALARELRARRPTLPVLLMSGYPDEKNQYAEIRQNEFAFLPKPFNSAALFAQLRALFERAPRVVPPASAPAPAQKA